MRTEKYSRYLSRLRALFAVDELDVEEADLLDYFQANIRYAWENFEWPELCPVEQRTPDSNGLIELDDGGTAIGEVFAIWDGDPNGTNGANELAFTLTPDGIQLRPGAYSTAWVHFRSRVPDYHGAVIDLAATYAVDDQVYDEDAGNFFRAITAGSQPVTNTVYWEPIEIPYCLFEFVVRAAYADAITGEGMDAKGTSARAKAEIFLQQEIDKVERQQRQRARHTVIRTHGSTQLRHAC